MAYVPQRHFFDRHALIIAQSLAGGSPDDRFSCEQVERILRVSAIWLDIARINNFGPPFEKDGRRVSYRRDKLITYLHARHQYYTRVNTTTPKWPAKKRQAVG
jgi:hypothetical protein